LEFAHFVYIFKYTGMTLAAPCQLCSNVIPGDILSTSVLSFKNLPLFSSLSYCRGGLSFQGSKTMVTWGSHVTMPGRPHGGLNFPTCLHLVCSMMRWLSCLGGEQYPYQSRLWKWWAFLAWLVCKALAIVHESLLCSAGPGYPQSLVGSPVLPPLSRRKGSRSWAWWWHWLWAFSLNLFCNMFNKMLTLKTHTQI
jgi:hypothetical protein